MRKVILLPFIVMFLYQSSMALGILYARRAGSGDISQPLWLKQYDAKVTITDQIAVTHVDHVFKNETNVRLEGVFVFPLPTNAVVTELALWINGTRVVASVKDRDTARIIYESIVRKSVDPALLEYMGNNVFKLSVFPIEPAGNAMSERRIEITYAELLPYQNGNVDYRFFMKNVNASGKPLIRASLVCDLTSQKKIVSLSCPSHAGSTGLSIGRLSDYNYHITYGNENTYTEKDFYLQYMIENSEYSISNLTYVPRADSAMFFDTAGDSPYFLIWIVPPRNSGKILDKRVVFVADVSSSMSGTRIEQLKRSLNAMVDMLNPGDRFNIVAFGTGIKKYKSDLAIADAANIDSAHIFINSLTEVGLTNMQDALKNALQSTWAETAFNTVFFLTDGKPTWPMGTTGSAVKDTVAACNKDSVSIFTFGIGDDIDEGFLNLLARENEGFFTHIAADDSISLVMKNFMQKISSPLIKSIAVNYGGLDISDILPVQLPNMYDGEQLTILGRYKTKGTYTVKFTGSQGSAPVVFSKALPFPSSATNNCFVPRMWASAKIDQLLDDIAVYGQQSELVNAVKRLGIKYNIVTPYTSMLVVEPGTPIVEDKTVKLSNHTLELRNTPNPFVSSTVIKFSLPASIGTGRVTLKILDCRGRLVRILVNDTFTKGNYMVGWDGTDRFGRMVNPGLFLAVLDVNGNQKMITMRLVK